MATTHGKCGSRIHNVWRGIKSRCENPNSPCFHRYGGRGISLCAAWQSFDQFYADMGDVPDGMSIERIDNEGNYEPGNCRWATVREQSRNRRSNVVLTHAGRTMCVKDWANTLGIPRTTLKNRLREGWSVERALTTPRACPTGTKA